MLLEDALAWSNEAVHNIQRPTTVYEETYRVTKTTVLDIAPGFAIESGKVVRKVLRTPLVLNL